MSYIVSARAPSGEDRFHRDSLIGTLDKGLTLLSVSMEVRITDPSGASRTPGEFMPYVARGPSYAPHRGLNRASEVLA